MILKIPLDLGFCDVFTEHRSEQRMRTGAMRRGFRFVEVQPTSLTTHSGIGAGQCSPAISDRVLGRRKPSWGQRGVGVRSRRLRRRRVEPGRRATVGNGDLLGRVRVILRGRTGRAGEATGSVGGASRPGATGQWFGAEGSGATPTGLREDGSDWHQDRWLGQPGQRESVTTGSGAGNRCRFRTRHRPPRRKARRAM